MIETLFFFLFATLAVVSALMVVVQRNPVHSVLSLIICFVQVACLFILLRSPFLAGAQLFVYVGAIMIFFVFAVFLLDMKSSINKTRFSGWFVIGVPMALFFVAEMVSLIGLGGFSGAVQGRADVNAMLSMGQSTKALGTVLYTKYLLPFEIISVVLLVGFVGAVVLTVKQKKEEN